MKSSNQLMETDIKLIERYLDYDLNEQESDEFYQRMETDSVFEQQVQAFQEAQEESLQIFQKEQVIAPIKQAKVVLIKPKRNWMYGLMAAAAVTLAVLFIPSLLQPKEDVPGVIAMAKEQTKGLNTDGLSLTVRKTPVVEQTPNEKAAQEVVDAYKNKNYQQLIDLTNNLKPTPDIWLLRAMAFKQQSELEKAKEEFLKVVKSNSGQKEIAYWGLVEIYLLQGDKHNAKIYLEELSKTDKDGQFDYGLSGKKAKVALDKL